MNPLHRTDLRRKRCTKSASPWPGTCGGVGIPEVINLFRDLDPIRWRQLDHNPIALLSEFTAERLGFAGGGVGAVQPHQPGVSAAEGIHGGDAGLGTHAHRRARLAAGRLFLPRIRRPRIRAHLFRRPGRPLGRPHQERQRPGRAAGGRRIVLRPGLFQAAPGHQRLPAGRVPGHEGGEPPHGAGPRPRRQADHRADRDPHGQAAGEGVADARGAGEAVPVGLRRSQQQPGRPRIDRPALRRRQPHADSPGIGGRRGRGPRPDGPGDYARASITSTKGTAPSPRSRPSACG